MPWSQNALHIRAPEARDWIVFSGLGILTFGLTPILLMTGLNATRATDTALIIGMEPVIAIILAAIFLKEKMKGYQWGALVLTLGGFLLLSGVTPLELTAFATMHFLGNALVLFSLFGEASYSVMARSYSLRFPATQIFGLTLTLGFCVFTVFVALVWGLPSFEQLSHHLSGMPLVGVLWMGPVGTTFSYIFWVVALRRATVATVALTLFIQPIFGAWLGSLFLDEKLGPWQFFGAALILVGVFLQTGVDLSRQR